MLAGQLFAAILAFQPAAGPTSDAFINRSLSHGGVGRTWAELVPLACSAQKARCITVVLLHGGRGALLRSSPAAAERGPDRLAERIGMAAAARRDGFVLLAPAALAGNWNDGRAGVADGIDDVGFLRAMLADASRRAPSAPARTFVAGVSNGGLMAFRFACEAPDRVRAIGAVVASMGAGLAQRCTPARPMNVVQVVGQRDLVMPYGGGGVGGRRAARGVVLSAAETFEFWAGRLSQPIRSETRLSDDVVLRAARAPDGRVEQHHLASYGHGWPGADDSRSRPQLRGSNPTGFDATARVLAFFKMLH